MLFSPVLLLTVSVSDAAAKDKFNLNPGARGKLCLSCHVAFKKTMKKPFVHTPLKKGACSGCHNPHASSHGNLLDSKEKDVCAKCHADMVPAGMKSVHKVVVEGKCVLCHDPHASDNKNNLIKAGQKLCFDCHSKLGESIKGNKFKHSPVKRNCLSCHNPHASKKNSKLLKNSLPALCLSCHKTNKASFKKLHLNYPVAGSNCTSCHNPHGSNTSAILYDNVHKPVANKMCSQCHDKPNASNPLKLKVNGYKLCQGCHYDMMNGTFSKDRVHWPLVDSKGCVNCHAPHASAEPGLLKEPMLKVCGSCHVDTIKRQERSQTKHEPVARGECTACHEPHSSNNVFLFNKPVIFDVCGKCHEWQTHSSHPIGEKVVDPRNPNLILTCLSCHRSHGTEYKHFLYAKTTTEMCTACHIQFKR